MRDYLIENLAGMCYYNCKRDRLSSDYCTVCLAAERLKEAEIQQQTLECVAQELEKTEAMLKSMELARDRAMDERDRLTAQLQSKDAVIVTLRAELDEALASREHWIRCRNDVEASYRERNEELIAVIATLRARNTEFHDAIRVLHTAVRGDEHSQWWSIRKWMDERDIFNDDLGSLERLVEAVCKRLLTGQPDAPSDVSPTAPNCMESITTARSFLSAHAKYPHAAMSDYGTILPDILSDLLVEIERLNPVGEPRTEPHWKTPTEPA